MSLNQSNEIEQPLHLHKFFSAQLADRALGLREKEAKQSKKQKRAQLRSPSGCGCAVRADKNQAEHAALQRMICLFSFLSSRPRRFLSRSLMDIVLVVRIFAS